MTEKEDSAMVEIGLLALPGCLNSAVDGLAEILTLANSLNGTPLFSTRILTLDGQPVRSYIGKTIESDGILGEHQVDMVVLPPILGELETSLRSNDIKERLRCHHASGGQLATICAGSLLLAETGILDGREATTHWNLAGEFRQRYPQVNLQVQRLIIDNGDYICCGGVSAWMDLALHLVSRYMGREISRQCAKMMLMDPHREHQTPYGMGGFQRNHGDTAILKVQKLLEESYADPLRVAEMANVAGLGERTLLRRFSKATGMSPGQYLQQVRIEVAQKLLETSDLSVERVAESVGYSDYSAFRKVFRKVMGFTPSSYRHRFGVLGQQG